MISKSNFARVARNGLISISCLALAMGCVCLTGAPAAATSCSLSAPVTWSAPSNGSWSAGSDWSGGIVPNSSSTNVCITNGASTVTLDVNASVANLQLGLGNTLTTNVGTNFSVNGPQLINGGSIAINGGGGSVTIFQLGNVTLTGGGAVTLNVSPGGGDSVLRGSGVTLTNVDNTIEGAGLIGDIGALTVVNEATINANASGQSLILNFGNGGVTNAGLLEATNGGTLALTNAITNSGGAITANGGTVIVGGGATIIRGGTLNTVGVGTIHNFGLGSELDGVTISSGSTYTAAQSTTSALANTITNKGTFQIDGFNTIVNLANNVTLQGGGAVNLVPGGALRGSGVTLTNVDNTIQGAGFIGNVGALDIVNKATINANGSVPHQALFLNEGNGGVTNTGVLEATNFGLLVLFNTIQNAGGAITDKGSGAVFVGGTIQGGTLNTSGGGTILSFVGAGTAPKLDGVTISSGSTYTAGLAGLEGLEDTITELDDTITNKGTFLINGGGGSNTIVNLGSNVTLRGGGVVTLSDVGGGSAFLRGAGVTLTNADNTIQGVGNIGDVGVLGFVNGAAGTLYANVSGGTLSVDTGSFLNGSFLNNGAVKVAGGATLSVTGDASGYVQNQVGSTAPVTQVDGTLMAPHGVAILAGVLEGTGTITGNVVSAGTVHPGDSPGVLTITGTYAQQASGIFDVTLAGHAPGTDYSQLRVGGSAALAGALDVFSANGFILAVSDTFEIMDFASSTGDFSNFDFNGQSCSLAGTDLWSCAGGFKFGEQFVSGHSLDLLVEDVGVTTGVPEPSTWAMILIGLGALTFSAYRRRQEAGAAGTVS